VNATVSLNADDLTNLRVTGCGVPARGFQVECGGITSSTYAYVTADEAGQIAEAWRLASEQIRANEITARLTTEAVTA
jgi:hypothetical protein